MMKLWEEYIIARCTSSGCDWMEAFEGSSAACAAAEYHCRREKHKTFNVTPMKDLMRVVSDAVAAIHRAGGPPDAA